jgi:hypothetical protein
MASPKSQNQPKTPETSKPKTKEELSQEELDKVAGGRRKVADPCDGGE